MLHIIHLSLLLCLIYLSLSLFTYRLQKVQSKPHIITVLYWALSLGKVNPAPKSYWISFLLRARKPNINLNYRMVEGDSPKNKSECKYRRKKTHEWAWQLLVIVIDSPSYHSISEKFKLGNSWWKVKHLSLLFSINQVIGSVFKWVWQHKILFIVIN